jgi:hypothetical protein
MQAEVAEDIRTIFNAPNRATTEAYLTKAVEKYQKTASRLAGPPPRPLHSETFPSFTGTYSLLTIHHSLLSTPFPYIHYDLPA